MTDLDSIKRLIGARKRHVVLNIDTAKEIKQRPIDGDLEKILDETRDKRIYVCMKASERNSKTLPKP